MKSRSPRILVVDDERHIVDFVTIGLEAEGMEVRGASNGSEAFRLLEEFRPDVVVLDLMLPDLSGFEVCRRIRTRSEVPILILSARDEVTDKVGGLRLGADDYLTKPFAFEEFAARIEVLLRRSGDATPGRVLYHADITLDPATREARRNGRPVRLTVKEFDLLHFLMQHPRQVLRKNQILEAVWGNGYFGEANAVEVLVSHLRRKLNAPGEPDPIRTVRGVGYRMGG